MEVSSAAPRGIVLAVFMGMSLAFQLTMLLTLALPVACISWTVTQEEVFREFRDYIIFRKRKSKRLLHRKFYYLFTCEYCFSHWIAAFFVAVTRFQLLVPGWAGYIIAFFALVWVANHYMTFYSALRLHIKQKRALADAKEEAAPAAPLGWFQTVQNMPRRRRTDLPIGAEPAMRP